MAVAVLTPVRATGSDLQATELVWSAALATDGAEFPMSGNDVVFFENVDEEDPVTVTVKSSQDQLGRVKDISQALAAESLAVVGAFTEIQGWRQPGGSMLITPSVASVLRVAVVRLPA